jgi:geranylgeranyl reductase family protein
VSTEAPASPSEVVYDVLIAGAGPAGSALAIELSREGYTVLLLDAARFPRDKVCGDYVSPRGIARLEELGCGDAVRAAACTPIRQSRLYLNRERLVEGSLPRAGALPSFGLAIPRMELDEIVFRRALGAGARALEGCRVEGFAVTPQGVEVRARVDGRPRTLRGRMLVGADGATSAVARTAGLQMRDPRHTLASIRAYAKGLTIGHTVMYFDEGYFPGYGWVFPVRPGLCNVGVGMVSEPLVRDRLRLADFYAKFQRFVRHLAAARGAEVEFLPQRAWPIHSYGGAGRNYFERGLLIGEAGCFVDPINGEGIPLAFESARIAARTVRAAFQRGRFGEADLARYERDWRAAFDPDLGISDLAVTMIRNRRLLPVWLSMFRATSLTAQGDARYAEVTGGILGGVVPARRGVTPEMFLRTLAHGPDFWRRVLGVEGPRTFADWFADGASLVRWQASVGRAVIDDPAWFRAWLFEVERKQRAVALRSFDDARRLVGAL